MTNIQLIDKLSREKRLALDEWVQLIKCFTDGDRAYAAELASATARFGKSIYFRGIIEFTNICKNNCYYCGIRCANKNAARYRLSDEEIYECCAEGYAYGYRTFVLQGGEDPYYTDDRLVPIVEGIHKKYPDCAITLSVGERCRQSYERLFAAGASRYLLRHETATKEHYAKLHPENMSLESRLECLKDLKEIGFQTGAGMMIGAPYQTAEDLARDMQFLCEFKPQMVGMGPFIPHAQTPFCDQTAGDARLTLLLLSLTRLALPSVLLPATTALGTVEGDGRKLGVLAGCNVVMPNLSPMSVRKKYLLYDNKAGTDIDAAASLKLLEKQMQEIGYKVVCGRGDYTEEDM